MDLQRALAKNSFQRQQLYPRFALLRAAARDAMMMIGLRKALMNP
jgi:hypothetical protein